MNVSLVSFYGEKPIPLVNLIQQLQTYLAQQKLTQAQFVPYQLAQVHGTIIGCEGFRSGTGIVNRWFKQQRQETRYIDLLGLVDYCQNLPELPLNIRFGGYDRNINHGFLSREQHLYDRSFQLQTDKNKTIPVLLGWSWQGDGVSLAIDNLRRQLQQFGLLHKYHATTQAMDNDFYLRLGTINARLTSAEIKAIATEIRDLLETKLTLDIPITVDNLAFVQYQDLALTPATTKIMPLTKVTVKQLEQLYGD